MENKLIGAATHLSNADPILAKAITLAGACTLKPHTNYYQELVDSIISQQLSVKAATTIERRFMDLFAGVYPAPEQILETPHETLRGAGLSNAKCNYVRDLAQHIIDGELELGRFNELNNEQIIQELTAVKGIGEWTAHMFLIFAMGRLDILAHGDLGIRLGIKSLYGLPDLPSPVQVQEIALKNNWHPYESVACWYIWHAKDNN
jgi:DNA-3-methyladenine glycosylase II